MTCKETTTTVWNGWCPSGSKLHTALARQVVVACKDREWGKGNCAVGVGLYQWQQPPFYDRLHLAEE